jgi:hypothetical protein
MAKNETDHLASPQISYHSLDSNKIISTTEILSQRIAERFPSSGLSKVAKQLLWISKQSQIRVDFIAKPLYWIRITLALLVVLIVLGLVGAILSFDFKVEVFHLFDVVQTIEAFISDMVFVGVGIFFLMTLESRMKRAQALKYLHELRAISHVIDMHQLTKDPESLLARGENTPSSPVRTMSAYEISRYLDYCSEMLSIAGKLAALYAQDFRDALVLNSVNEIESLTTGLSGKIWQKLMILYNQKLESPMQTASTPSKKAPV